MACVIFACRRWTSRCPGRWWRAWSSSRRAHTRTQKPLLAMQHGNTYVERAALAAAAACQYNGSSILLNSSPKPILARSKSLSRANARAGVVREHHQAPQADLDVRAGQLQPQGQLRRALGGAHPVHVPGGAAPALQQRCASPNLARFCRALRPGFLSMFQAALLLLFNNGVFHQNLIP